MERRRSNGIFIYLLSIIKTNPFPCCSYRDRIEKEFGEEKDG